jgi:endonuclease YncB( thermonuclease family)
MVDHERGAEPEDSMTPIEPAYRYRAEVLDVHDGDTFRLRVDLGFRCAVTIQCRLHGVDCPELNTPEGKEARRFVFEDLFAQHFVDAEVVIESYKDQRSFERWVCDVWLRDGRSVGDVLVAAGHGRRL